MNKSEKLDELVTSVEELLARLPETLDPEIVALRDTVDDGIFDAWRYISSERSQPAHSASRGAASSIGAAIGFVILALSAKLLLERSTRRQRMRNSCAAAY